jgi:hypothetical protein
MTDEIKEKVDKFERMRLPESEAGLAATTGSVEFERRLAEIKKARAASMLLTGPEWSKEDILNGLWDMYLEHCEMMNKRDGTYATRFSDLERALAQMERQGLPPNSQVSEAGPLTQPKT